jgi:hypothetical protein
MTSSGIDPATFRLVAQFLNQQRYRTSLLFCVALVSQFLLVLLLVSGKSE